MKKVYLFIIVLALCFGPLQAKPVDQITARNLALKFLKNTTLGANKSHLNLNLVHTFSSTRGQDDLFAFNVEGGGFIIMAADNRVKPVLAYSLKGSFDASDIAEGFNLQIAAYQEEIEYIRAHRLTATPDIVAEWKSVSETGQIYPSRSLRSVGPLMETTWNQNIYYNSQCPYDTAGSGNHVYSGCVACAMAQVMRFWGHPMQGSGSHSYTPGESGMGYPSYPTQTANFGETHYHFELMPTFLDSTSTDEEIFYIAQLQHHCGIAVEMMYSPNGSGAFSFMVPYAMTSFFKYSNCTLQDKWMLSNEEWGEMLKTELDAGRPMYYSGSDDGGAGGHAFVCDGYDENNMFHFNWGWGSRDDAFCAIGALNTTKYAFNQSNSAITNCFPASEDYFSRPQRISNLTLEENSSFDGVNITWTNPANNLNGQPLTAIDSVIVRRNFMTVATFTNAQIGGTMSFTDNVPQSRMYQYSVYVKSGDLESLPVYADILVGEKCDIVFNLNDEGSDGWKGASISVTDANGNRIGIVTMKEGAHETQTVALLKGNLNFIWNSGWFHSQEAYDTDDEISFTINDAEGNELFSSPDELNKGLLFSYNNNCNGQISCGAPLQLKASYVFNNDTEFGSLVEWDKPSNSGNVTRFNVYRSTDGNSYTAIGQVDYVNGTVHYSYFDAVQAGTYYYQVKAVHEENGEVCESSPAHAAENPSNLYVMLTVTANSEHAAARARVYPNPVQGTLYIEVNGLRHIKVMNLMGQTLIDQEASGNQTHIDMSSLDSGLYMIQIETNYGTYTKHASHIR